jgi:Family of unknown function (DUF5695)/F5/8 type C domain
VLDKKNAQSLKLILIAIFVICSSILAFSQQLENNQFKIGFSPAGVTSLKRAEDVFDTDYILGGKSLGGVLVRYRATGEAWKEISSGTSASQRSPSEITYEIGRAVPTIATASRANSSVGPWQTRALNDQAEPKNSHDKAIPFFAWGDRRGTEEWVEYNFHAPKQVSSVEVYWAVGSYEDYKWNLPVSWKIQYRDGDQWKDVHASDKYGVAPDQFNHVSFEPVTTSILRLLAKLPQDATSGIYEWRVNTDHGKDVDSVPEIAATGAFRLEKDSLVWTIEARNQTSKPLEVGDLGVTLPFNTDYVPDKTETYTKRLIRHSFIGGDGSYIFWMRCNGIGPYLVMLPEAGSHLEYYDQPEGRSFTAYVHSAARAEELAAKGGKWRLPNTKLTLAPKGQPGDSAKYSFRFHWAKDYAGVRDVLYEEGGIDVNVVPGMTVPTDLPTMFSLRTHNKVRSIVPEFPDTTFVKLVGEPGTDTHVYAVKFSHLGENMLKVQYGDGQYLSLEFFVTEPLETLIKKRARFMMTHEQWNDPKRWYTGLYSQWDMKHQILRSPDDLDELQSYAVACDDPALGKAPYLAAKNVFFPDKDEIGSIENYIQHYVWGGLQQTDKEPYPYGIYGIPNWKVNRESPEDNERGKKHLWRIYDYPHVILLYYNMYLIAKDYPSIVHYLDASGYLERAYRTAMAFFTVPIGIVKWSAYETGTYNELVIPDLIRELEQNGRKSDADKLRAHWETKAAFFINQHPDLFQSEYPFDSTGFESTHALATYAVQRLQDPEATEFRKAVNSSDANDFLEEQMRLNVAARGTEPAYFWMGSDYRASGNTAYTLSYMSQMGGWAVEDYALNFAHDPVPYLRLGYASYLSSWALLNSGTAASNYGYWFPGKENDGGAGGGFEPRPWGRAWLGNKEMGHGSWWYSGEIDLGFSGALRTAATVVSDDPIFGLYAYGGELTRHGATIQVIPRDGLRDRFDVVLGKTSFQMRLDRDGFDKDQPIVFSESLDRVTFRIENRSNDQHETTLTLKGLPPGGYRILSAEKLLFKSVFSDGEEKNVKVTMSPGGASIVTINRD